MHQKFTPERRRRFRIMFSMVSSVGNLKSSRRRAKIDNFAVRPKSTLIWSYDFQYLRAIGAWYGFFIQK